MIVCSTPDTSTITVISSIQNIKRHVLFLSPLPYIQERKRERGRGREKKEREREREREIKISKK